ncbi:LLM class F420-dependent oxidoreductase [soil metagenome]
MSELASVPLGVTVAILGVLGPPGTLEVARRAESLGYRSVWVAEANGAEAFSSLAALSTAAPSLGLGTGVVALQLRTPFVVAMAGATLQALAPEVDVLLGVGISSPVVTTRWHGAPYGERPLARVREYVTLVQAYLSGERVDHAGDFYTVKGARLGVRLGERRPKVVVAALNPGMLRLAGEVADGVLLNYLPASHVAWSVEQVRAGEAAAGRPPGSTTVYGYVHAGVCERGDGIGSARRDLFSYAVVDAYARNFERAGFGDEVAAIRAAHGTGDREGALAAVSDRMVDAIDVMGDADRVAAAVQAYVDAGVEVPVLIPLPWGSERMGVVDATLRAAAGILAS